MIKVCSALYGNCMPEFQHPVVFDNWYDCAQYGLTETKSLMTEVGPEVVNRDKITVSFVCKESSETRHCVKNMTDNKLLFSPYNLSPFSLVG